MSLLPVSLAFVRVMERKRCTKMGKLNASNHIKKKVERVAIGRMADREHINFG